MASAMRKKLLLRRAIRAEVRDLARLGYSENDIEEIIKEEYGDEMAAEGIDIGWVLRLIQLLLELFAK